LEKREIHLERILKTLKEDARFCVKTNKNKALMLLKKAKMNEKQLLSIYGQKENIETQIFALEQGISNQDTINCMKQGKKAIDNMTKNLDPDDVCDLVDNIATSMDIANEIGNALSVPIGHTYDDEELLQEFDNEFGNNYVPVNEITEMNIQSKNIKEVTEDEEISNLIAMM
jgi:hypothetical protein